MRLIPIAFGLGFVVSVSHCAVYAQGAIDADPSAWLALDAVRSLPKQIRFEREATAHKALSAFPGCAETILLFSADVGFTSPELLTYT